MKVQGKPFSNIGLSCERWKNKNEADLETAKMINKKKKTKISTDL